MSESDSSKQADDISQIYQAVEQLDESGPPAALDQHIKQIASDNIKKSPERLQWFSYAAVVILSFSIIFLMPLEHHQGPESPVVERYIEAEEQPSITQSVDVLTMDKPDEGHLAIEEEIFTDADIAAESSQALDVKMRRSVIAPAQPEYAKSTEALTTPPITQPAPLTPAALQAVGEQKKLLPVKPARQERGKTKKGISDKQYPLSGLIAEELSESLANTKDNAELGKFDDSIEHRQSIALWVAYIEKLVAQDEHDKAKKEFDVFQLAHPQHPYRFPSE